MKNSRVIRVVLVGSVLTLCGFVTWFAWHVRRSDEAWGDVLSYNELLVAYVGEHRGRLPTEAKGLVDEGYASLGEDGEWQLERKRDGNRLVGIVARPDCFDVAWGTTPDQVTQDGRLVSTGRLLVEPSEDCPYERSLLAGLSGNVARAMRKHLPHSNPPTTATRSDG